MTKPPLAIVLFFPGDDPCISEMPDPIARRAGLRVCVNIYPALAGTLFSAFHTVVLAYHAQSHVQPVSGKVIEEVQGFRVVGHSGDPSIGGSHS